MTAWRSLQSTDTGHVFASTLGASKWWEWIESAVAHEFECDVDDVDLFEDDDMNEFVTPGSAARLVGMERATPLRPAA